MIRPPTSPAPAHRAADHGPTAAAGLTLLELLLTMGLIGLLLGAGVGVFAGLDFEGERGPAAARAVLRAARSAAADEGQPARVEVGPDGRELRVHAARVVASFAFEGDGTGGQRGMVEQLSGARRVADGFLGKGIAFAGAGNDANCRIELGSGGRIDLREGFALRLRVRADDAGGGALLDLGGVVGLEVRPGGVLLASIQPKGTERVDLESPPGALETHRWTELGLCCDRVLFELRVDGFPVARIPFSEPLAEPARTLLLGGRPRPFPGVVDELVLWSYTVERAVELPVGTEWPAGAPRAVCFDRDGALAPLSHPDGFELAFASEFGPGTTIRVSRFGVVQ